MTRFFKLAQMLIGGAALLLFAGGFPRFGVPEIYHSGAMLLLGILGAIFVFFAAYRIVDNKILAFLKVTVFALLTVASVWFSSTAVATVFTGEDMGFYQLSFEIARALLGLSAALCFAYFSWRSLDKRISLAWAHLSMLPLAFGAYLDYAFELNGAVPVIVDHEEAAETLRLADEKRAPFGFSLFLNDFELSHYDGERYDMYEQDGQEWKVLGKMELRDGELYFENASWSLSELQHDKRMGDRAFLFIDGKPMRLIYEAEPTVKQYKVDYILENKLLGETLRGVLRINEPIEYQGWQFSLMSYREMESSDQVLIQLEARHAPGRFWARAGMLGLIISIATWCWIPNAPRKRKEMIV